MTGNTTILTKLSEDVKIFSMRHKFGDGIFWETLLFQKDEVIIDSFPLHKDSNKVIDLHESMAKKYTLFL